MPKIAEKFKYLAIFMFEFASDAFAFTSGAYK